MGGRFGAADLTAALMLAVTIWVLVTRYRGVVESNWPVLYYGIVILYSLYYPGVLDPAWVFAGVVSALLLRFEFMGGIFLKIMRVLDVIILLYLAYSLLSYISF